MTNAENVTLTTYVVATRQYRNGETNVVERQEVVDRDWQAAYVLGKAVSADGVYFVDVVRAVVEFDSHRYRVSSVDVNKSEVRDPFTGKSISLPPPTRIRGAGDPIRG